MKFNVKNYTDFEAKIDGMYHGTQLKHLEGRIVAYDNGVHDSNGICQEGPHYGSFKVGIGLDERDISVGYDHDNNSLEITYTPSDGVRTMDFRETLFTVPDTIKTINVYDGEKIKNCWDPRLWKC